MDAPQDHGYAGRYPGSWVSLLLALTGHALVNPRVAIDLLATGWAFRRRNWLTRFPFLPLPDVAYLKWRMYTAFGDEDAVPPVIDVLRFARWRREVMRL